jgi:multicomponent Na+:H+ antiporter subunit B
LIIAVAIIRQRNLLAAAMLAGIYSLLMASVFVILDAVDVAFTEAAVGAGITTVLMLGTLALTDNHEKIPLRQPLLPLLVALAVGGLLVYGTIDMPRLGDAGAPIHQHVADRYIALGPVETGMPNMVTSVLASYRGFDTLGELTVIFTAGIGVLLLLGRRRKETKDQTEVAESGNEHQEPPA